MDFKFDKPFYSERELLKLVPVKRSTFYSWQSQWISLGNDPFPRRRMTHLPWDIIYFLGMIHFLENVIYFRGNE